MVTTTAPPATEVPEVVEELATTSPEQLDSLWETSKPTKRYEPWMHCPGQKLRTLRAFCDAFLLCSRGCTSRPLDRFLSRGQLNRHEGGFLVDLSTL